MTTEVLIRPRARPFVPTPTVAPELWPLVLCSAGVLPLYFVGASAFVWSVPGAVFGAWLLRDPRLRIVVGGGPLVALLVWIALSGVQLRSTAAVALFAYRWSIFASVAAVFLWLVQLPASRVSTAAVVRVLAWGFPVLVVFGYLAILWPRVDLPTPVRQMLPGSLADDPYVRDLTAIRFAEVQRFGENRVPRVAAPFAYANGWGAAMAFTFPFWVVHTCLGATRRARVRGYVGLAAAVIPVIVSLNRGLWLGIGIVVVYAAIRRAVAGDRRTARRVLGATAIAVALVLATPLGDLVDARFEGSEQSNETRGNVAAEAIAATWASPLLGYGAPGQADTGPAIGTHGLWWYLMYCHGFIGFSLFAVWLLGSLRHAVRSADRSAVWLAGGLVAAPVLALVYGLLPQIVLIGVLAGLARRDAPPRTRSVGNIAALG